MAEPVKKDEALAAAVREAFQRHMENARLAAQALKEKQAQAQSSRQTGTSAPVARDPRMKVPEPANQRDGGPALRAPATQAAPAAESSGMNPSLGRLVALASPQKVKEAPPELPPVAASKPEEQAAEPSAEVPALPVEVDAEKEPAAEPAFDFGEALFNEISQELDGKAAETAPRMPKAASLPTPTEVERAADDSSDGSPAKRPGVRDHLGLVPEETPAAPMQAADPQGKSPPPPPKSSVIPLPPPRKTSRFGVAPPPAAEAKRASRFAPTRPVNTNDALFTAGARRTSRIRIPAALVASVVVGAAIIGVASYFWTYPEKLRSLGSLITPPALRPSGANVATTNTAPAEPAKTAPPAAASRAEPLSHTVSTVTIKVDEVDQAVQSARELVASGNVEGARAILDTYRTGTDPRALFALAETYDPTVIHDPAQANASQAKAFYEAAAKAGSKDTADRIARLQVDHVN